VSVRRVWYVIQMAEKTKNKKLSVTADQELRILRNVVDIASSELDLNLTLQLIVKIVTEMTDADSVFVYLFDESKQNLVLMASKTAKGSPGGWPAKTRQWPLKPAPTATRVLKVSMCSLKTVTRPFYPFRSYIRERPSGLSMSSTKASRIIPLKRSI